MLKRSTDFFSEWVCLLISPSLWAKRPFEQLQQLPAARERLSGIKRSLLSRTLPGSALFSMWSFGIHHFPLNSVFCIQVLHLRHRTARQSNLPYKERSKSDTKIFTKVSAWWPSGCQSPSLPPNLHPELLFSPPPPRSWP